MALATTNETLAIVAHGAASSGQWKLESITPRPIRDDEVLVRIVASGICPADLHFGDVSASEASRHAGIWYPRVLGHEGQTPSRIEFGTELRPADHTIRHTGSGYVEQVGRSVSSVSLGDPVLLSYSSCGECYSCQGDHPAYCTRAVECNFVGEKGMYAQRGRDTSDVGGSFFGQSSFSGRAIVKVKSVVNFRGVGLTTEDLQTLAPLGCGVQTGTGAFINTAGIQAHQSVAVIGVGGVGQSAIMVRCLLEVAAFERIHFGPC